MYCIQKVPVSKKELMYQQITADVDTGTNANCSGLLPFFCAIRSGIPEYKQRQYHWNQICRNNRKRNHDSKERILFHDSSPKKRYIIDTFYYNRYHSASQLYASFGFQENNPQVQFLSESKKGR